MNKTAKKTSSGWTMAGICLQWAKRNEDMTTNEKLIYWSILDKSFGFAKRYCYLKYDDFELSNRNTISKTISSLVSKGIISYKNTYSKETGHKSMNEYRILEPKSSISRFIFVGYKEEKIKEKEIEEEDEDNPWK
jgi:hypothetical protein